MQSLASNNKNLLLENRGLYRQLKDGMEWMKQEKVQQPGQMIKGSVSGGWLFLFLIAGEDYSGDDRKSRS